MKFEALAPLLLVVFLSSAAMPYSAATHGGLAVWEAGPSNLAEAQASQKVIKDPAEYKAYMAAFDMQDPRAKARAMEEFVSRYPQSVVRIDALEQAMATYQATGNVPQLEDTANRIVALDPANVRALAILTYLKRAAGRFEATKEAQSYAERGLQALAAWRPPEGMTEADFQKLRDQMAVIFYGAAGWGHLETKEYALARDDYLKAIRIDATNVQNMYQIGLCNLESKPIDLSGFWYMVKAANLARAAKNDDAAAQIMTYARARYQKYHGAANAWDKFVASVSTQEAPPSAAELAKAIPKKWTLGCMLAEQTVRDNKLENLSFADYALILKWGGCTLANQEAADKVWAHIQEIQRSGKAKVRVTVKVISSTRLTMDAALTEANQSDNSPDLHVVFGKPPLPPPAPGSMIDIMGVFTSYTTDPFALTMEMGELPPPNR